MIFSSMIFLFVFFPVILLGYYGILRKLEHRNVFLLVASLFFYAWGEPRYVLIMLLSICFNFAIGSYLEQDDKVQAKQALMIGVCCNLLLLFLFKYENFVVQNFNRLLGGHLPLRLESLQLPLPIGISFFTFQGISYLVDVYRGTAKAQKNILDLGLYISFFPQLVAGPIVRYETIAQQITDRTCTYSQFTQGVKRFILGMSKKIILANQCAVIAEASFQADLPSVSLAWLGAIAYSLQIYYDFSGYSDMAIGLGHMFGFTFLENFNYPYISKNVTEFWRRWHISLGSWFRDYVYIPMGGSRVKGPRLILNLFVVWVLTGVWHGANYQFILWGMLYFLLLTFEKVTKLPERLQHWLGKSIYQVFTLVMIMAGWVIFGESSIIGGLQHIWVMLGNSPVLVDMLTLRYLRNYAVVLCLAVVFATPLIPTIWAKKTTRTPKVEVFSSLGYLLLFYISVSYLVMGSHNPFIYFNF